jgi:replicative DNA helicase
MARVRKDILQRYYDSRSACYVLSMLMKKTKLLKSKERPLHESYFITKTHKALFVVIKNLYEGGLETVKLGDVETYLATHDQLTYKRFFEVGDETEWILELLELETDETNYNYYYDIVRKFAFLRAKMETGQDVSDILDMSEVDSKLLDEQYRIFVETPLQEIIKEFDRRNMEVKGRFIQRNEEDSRKVGEDAEELFERLQDAPDMGWRHAGGQMMDTISRGCRRGMLTIESRESGCGKTRQGIQQCCMLACDTLWDYASQSFQPNPFGETVPALYIGTEMKLYEEIEPIVWSVISGVEEHKIRNHTLTSQEKERVMTAIQIAKRSEIYLENEPDYTCAFIEYKVDEYKVNHNIGALIFDYIELIPTLTAEYVQMSKGVAAREDMVLLHLSTHLKNLANSYDIYVHAFTQIANDARRDETIRDSGAIKGGKSLQARADLAVVTMRPTHKELTALQPIIDKYKYPTPNLCYNVYKNRGGIHVMVKVWSIVNLGNMQIENLFATNWSFQRIRVEKSNTVKLQDDFIIDEETGEIIEQPKKKSRRTEIKHR